jgi:hypothetical protein
MSFETPRAPCDKLEATHMVLRDSAVALQQLLPYSHDQRRCFLLRDRPSGVVAKSPL